MPAVKWRCEESLKLLISAHVCCYCWWKNSKYRNIYFASMKFVLIKSYHLRMCNRILLWSGKLLQWNCYVKGTIFESLLRFRGWPQWDCHVNGTTFQSGFRFQTGVSSLRVSCKRVLKVVFIDAKCGKFKVVIDGGELTINTNQKKTSGVLQAYRSSLSDKCCRREYFLNKKVEYCESVVIKFFLWVGSI